MRLPKQDFDKYEKTIAHIVDTLERHEGFRSKVYKCSAGKNTVGYGRNLDDKGITVEEAAGLLINDVCSTVEILSQNELFMSVFKSKETDFSFLDYNSSEGQIFCVLMNMAYNLGVAGLLGFKKMFKALQKGDYVTASAEMLDSKWAKQVPKRAQELASIVKNC